MLCNMERHDKKSQLLWMLLWMESKSNIAADEALI